MDKDKIKTGLRAAGIYHRYDKTAYWWKEAFKLWSKETGNAIDMGCTRCIRGMKEWLDK